MSWTGFSVSAPRCATRRSRSKRATAIRSGSQVVVTENIEDFPCATLGTYNIEAQTPDIFVLYLIELSPTIVSNVVQSQATAHKNPHMSVSDVPDRLARSGLPRSVAALREY